MSQIIQKVEQIVIFLRMSNESMFQFFMWIIYLFMSFCSEKKNPNFPWKNPHPNWVIIEF